MASLFTSIVPRWFYKTTRYYIKEGRIRLSESDARKARCRGDVRAAQRRLDREKDARWRRAHERALPFRMKIVERLEAEKKRMVEQVFGKRREA